MTDSSTRPAADMAPDTAPDAVAEPPVLTHAILVDAYPGSDYDGPMAALFERRCSGALPAAGKPLVQFWCEGLAEMGFSDIHLVLSHFPEQIRNLVGNGQRWGLNISTSSVHEGTSPTDTLKSAASFVTQPTLIAALDSLPLAGLSTWIKSAAADSSRSACLDQEGKPLPLSILRENWFDQGRPEAMICPESTPAIRVIDSPRALWQANMDLLEGKIHDPLPVGYALPDHPQIRMGFGIQQRPNTTVQAPCTIGEHTMLGSRVQLGPNVVIGSHCIIDEASQIRECVILDNTFIGTHSELQMALVDGRMIYRVDHDIATWIDDPLILGHTDQSKGFNVPLLHRLTALILLVITLPLILLAALTSLLRSGKGFTQDEVIVPTDVDLSGAMDFNPLPLTSLDVANPLWRKLPWLRAVISGDLPLFGITPRSDPRSDSGADIPDWARELIQHPPGMMALSDVTGVISQGEMSEDVLVTDSYYLATRGRKSHIALLGRWLLGLVTSLFKPEKTVKST